MLEAGYQSKIINKIKERGGWAVNGNYTTDGEADLQCGIPLWVGKYLDGDDPIWESKKVLLYVAVEVKTEKDYHRVMSGIDKDYNVIDKKKLKKHEPLQMAKIRKVRSLGGLALVAFEYNQIMGYINESKV